MSCLEPLPSVVGSLRHARPSARAVPIRTAVRHVTATEVGGALVPKLIGELLRPEQRYLDQVVPKRLQLEKHQ